VSTMGDVLGSETVAASDALAARLDELQFDLGEGPCWDAVLTGMPVLQPDVHSPSVHSWPAFSAAIRDDEVASIFAFPLTVGTLRLGAVDLYSAKPSRLDHHEVRRGSEIAEDIARQLLRQSIRDIRKHENNEDEDDSIFSRRVVHQATGMVLAQLNISADDALMLIRGHAFASGRSVREIAQDVVARRLDFRSMEYPTEESR
jgi:ANTAR domain/GAF domain